MPSAHVLLVLQVLIGGDEDIESVFLGGSDQVAVRRALPAHVAGGDNFIIFEMIPKSEQRVLIKQDAGHAVWRIR